MGLVNFINELGRGISTKPQPAPKGETASLKKLEAISTRVRKAEAEVTRLRESLAKPHTNPDLKAHLAELRNQLRQARVAIELGETPAQSTQDLESAIAQLEGEQSKAEDITQGLQERLAAAEQDLAGAKAEQVETLRAYLQGRFNQEAKAYMEQARALTKDYGRLRALSVLHSVTWPAPEADYHLLISMTPPELPSPLEAPAAMGVAVREDGVMTLLDEADITTPCKAERKILAGLGIVLRGGEEQ